MKKSVKIFLVLIAFPLFSVAQKSKIDRLNHALSSAKTNAERFVADDNLYSYYLESDFTKAVTCIDQMYAMAVKNNHHYDAAYALDDKGYCLLHFGKYPEAYTTFQQALKLVQADYPGENIWEINNARPDARRMAILASIHHDLGHLMGLTGNLDEQIAEYRLTKKLSEQDGDQMELGYAVMNLGRSYNKLGKEDSALMLEKKAVTLFKQKGDLKYVSSVDFNVGNIYLKQEKISSAKAFFYAGANFGIAHENLKSAATCYHALAKIYLSAGKTDSALYCAKQSLFLWKKINSNDNGFIADLYESLYQIYESGQNRDSAFKYVKLALVAKDTSYNTNIKNLTDFETLTFKSQLQLQKLAQEKETTQNKLRTGILIAGIVLLLLLAGIFYRNNLQKQKANSLLSEQKQEVQNALLQLKSTQNQLIQAEKLASLGELTAGIAHEIQNPLNFVNNFSDLNRELIDELRDSLKRNDIPDALSIADDIQQNEEKVSHHGKRADGIVKNMLQHSRNNSGEKEPTDINALADEYLRLSYHGLRAKDKSFNADMVTNFDTNLPKVNIIPQDAGRVLLNLYNNAFYAVQQKTKTAGADYKPKITVTTLVPAFGGGGVVAIIVTDNGTGMPADVKEKILQPFFTTKPTGEGTGLGLSLSYDIVVKGHGGSIHVDTQEGEYTEFTVTLPL